MSVLKYFKNTPGRPLKGRQALSVFFSLNLQRGPWKKKGGLSPPQRATGGACRPPSGDRGIPPIKGPALPFSPHLSPKIPPKIQKKREK